MQSLDVADWKVEAKNEKLRFDKFNIITDVPCSQLPKDTKVMTMTWAIKKKPNGMLRGGLTVRCYEKIEGKSSYNDSIVTHVTNANLVQIMWVLMAAMPARIAKNDMEGVFLQGQFMNREVVYIEVPDRIEELCGSKEDVTLLLNAPIYGRK